MNRTRIFGQAQSGASAGNRARVVLLLMLLLVASGARADTEESAAGTAGNAVGAVGAVAVKVQEVQGTYSVRAELRTSATPEVAWNVLSDYDHIDTFVQSMRASTSERRADGQLLVRQIAAVGVFPIHKTVRVDLEVVEVPGHSIAFHDVLGRDFRAYAGAWDIGQDSTGTIVYYWLEAAPKAFVPFVGRRVMAKGVRDLLSQVGSEMQRRAALEETPSKEHPAASTLRSTRDTSSLDSREREIVLKGE
jgi:hypothetical protein